MVYERKLLESPQNGFRPGANVSTYVANVIATFKTIRKPPKLQQKLDSFVQQRET